MKGVIRAGWRYVGTAMFMPVIGNVVYEATFDATESSGRMEPRGRASLQAEKLDVNQTLLNRNVRGGQIVSSLH